MGSRATSPRASPCRPAPLSIFRYLVIAAREHRTPIIISQQSFRASLNISLFVSLSRCCCLSLSRGFCEETLSIYRSLRLRLSGCASVTIAAATIARTAATPDSQSPNRCNSTLAQLAAFPQPRNPRRAHAHTATLAAIDRTVEPSNRRHNPPDILNHPIKSLGPFALPPPACFSLIWSLCLSLSQPPRTRSIIDCLFNRPFVCCTFILAR